MFVNSTLQTLGISLADCRTGLFTFGDLPLADAGRSKITAALTMFSGVYFSSMIMRVFYFQVFATQTKCLWKQL